MLKISAVYLIGKAEIPIHYTTRALVEQALLMESCHNIFMECCFVSLMEKRIKRLVQVNLCQKISFLNQLTHNMTRDCSLISKKNTLFFCFCFDIQNNICTQHVVNLYFSWNSMNNLSSYCGLTGARMRASEKYLPVPSVFMN